MSPETERGLVALIEARAVDLAALNIAWFGGEPLLAADIVKRVSRRAKQLAQLHGFTFTSGMTTNAYLLTQSTFLELAECGVDYYQITLDGDGSGHDLTRRRADGKGTFDTIWKNLVAIRELDCPFEILLRIHVTHQNHDSLRTLCSKIASQVAGDRRFRYNFQDVRNLSPGPNPNVVSVSATDFKRIARELDSIINGTTGGEGDLFQAHDHDEPPEKYRPQGESASGRRAYELNHGDPYICYAAKPNHFLIRADGRVGKCTVALSSESNNLGHLLPTGVVKVNQELARQWFRGIETLDLEALACPLQGIDMQRSGEREKAPLSLKIVA